MVGYIATFLFEFIPVLILWLIIRKIPRIYNYKCGVLIILIILSLIIGYIFSSRGVGYEITYNYLTEVNDLKIKTTGREITLEEENQYKQDLFNSEEYKKSVFFYSIKESLISLIGVVLIMLIFIKHDIFRKKG